jgi:predicted SnoaL-like aldol condensation-catalyzing enzyme
MLLTYIRIPLIPQIFNAILVCNYVLAVSEGSFGGAATSFYDLWRVENGKVTEHGDVMETIAAKDTWQNQNGKF